MKENVMKKIAKGFKLNLESGFNGGLERIIVPASDIFYKEIER